MDERALRNRCELVQHDVEPVAERKGAWSDERVAAMELVPLDSRQRDRDALSGVGDVDRFVVHLNAPDPNVQARGLGAKVIAGRDAAGPERSGRDSADPVQREDAVHVQSRRRLPRTTVLQGSGGARKCGP